MRVSGGGWVLAFVGVPWTIHEESIDTGEPVPRFRAVASTGGRYPGSSGVQVYSVRILLLHSHSLDLTYPSG